MQGRPAGSSISPTIRVAGKTASVLFVAAYDVSIASFFLPHLAVLQQLGLQVETAYCRSVDWAHEAIGRAGVERHEVSFGSTPYARANVAALQGLGRLLRRNKYDIVHANMPVPGYLARLACRLFSRQSVVIYTAHGFHFHQGGRALSNAAFETLERLAGRWTDYLVTINQEDYEAARRLRIVAPDRVWPMPGVGIDTAYFDPARVRPDEIQAVRQGMALASDDVLLLMVAGFRAGKRHRDAIAALAELRDSRVHLAFAGRGPLLEATRTLSQAHGVAERVHFLGYRSDVRALVCASLATLLPSEREGLPRSMQESLALGVPVIGADVRGTRELLRDGCGVVVPVGDVHGLTNAVRWVLAHPERANDMGRRGRQRVIERYALPLSLGVTEKLYRHILELQ
jgi:glycosyltransferase involved in cell wall biosynthesis